MKESAAWREIAERIATRGLIGIGLCREVHALYCRRVALITYDMSWRMYARIEEHLFGRMCMDLDGADERDGRVLAALFLSLEAADEERAARRVSGNPNRSTE